MKSNSLTVPATASRKRVQVTPFTWENLFAVVSNLRNHLPEPWQDVIPVTNVRELKTASLLLSILFLIFFLAALYDSVLLQEGGAL